MTKVEKIIYNRYYKLMKQEYPRMSEPEIVTKAKELTQQWTTRRLDSEYEDRAKTEYNIWGNI